MKKKLLNNWLLKLASLVMAFALWFIVVNIDNPVTEKSYRNIPVRLINTESITDQNMVYEILENTGVVRTVTILAPRDITENISDSDIVAEADFDKITINNTVEINFYSTRYNSNITSITGSNEILKLNIEERRNKRLSLSVNTTGTVASGYLLGNVTPDQNSIEISGPESVVSSVKTASVSLDVTDATANISTYTDITLYDADGNEVSVDNLTMNTNSVLVKVEVLSTKTIPIEYAYSGTTATGYMATGVIDSDPVEVTIAGSRTVLDGISSLVVPEDVLNITGQSADMLTIVDLREYLPTNVSFADDSFNGRASVTVYIEKSMTRELTISSTHIRLLNVPEGYTAELSDGERDHTLTVTGLASDVNALSPYTMYANVDVSDLISTANAGDEEAVAGSYVLVPDFGMNENLVITTPITVTVIVTAE